MLELRQSSDQERLQAWWNIFLCRKPLEIVPEDLAPVGSVVRLATGVFAEVISWLDLDPDENSGVAHKRLAYVLGIDGPCPGVLHGLVPEDEVQLWHTQDQPKYLPGFLGKAQ